nr:retrotransposon Orf1 [Tanacetum cinerariifolium]
MGIAIYGRPEETRVENFLGDVVRAMMSLSGTMVASFKNIHSFLPVHTPLDNLIGTNPKEIGEIIVNGDSPPPMRTVDGIKQTYPPTTAEEKLARKNKLKSRGLPEKIGTENLATRENRYIELVRRNVIIETIDANALMAQERFGYDWSDQAEDGPTNLALMTYTSLEHYDNLSKDYKKYQFNVGAYKTDLGSVEARLVVYKKSKEIFEDNIKILKLDIYLRDNALTKLRKKLEKAEKERDEIKITLEKFENSSKTLNKIEDENETETKSKQRKPSFAKIEFAKHNEQMKSHRESVKQEEHNRQAKHPRKNNQSPRGNKRNQNNLMSQRLGNDFKMLNKACHICGSFEHLQYTCKHNKGYLNGQRLVRLVWNNTRKGNHQNSLRNSNPHPKRNFVPRTVLIRCVFKTLNTARQNSSRAVVSVNSARKINTAYPRPTINSARPVSNVFNRVYSHGKMPINNRTTSKNSKINKKVNTIRAKHVNTVRPEVNTVRPKAVLNVVHGNQVNVVKALACWVWRS